MGLIKAEVHGLGGETPFIGVSCSVLSENLLESELFGHVKGAFTGAVKDKTWRFELADGGTLFLDKIGDMSLNLQTKLLRVLQEREFEKVGGEKTTKVNVHIITATNKDLKKEAAQGKFREDLYYRLNVVKINLPPLRERMDDLPLLVTHFIEKFNQETGKDMIWGALRAHNKHVQKIDGAVQQWAPIVFDAVNDMVERSKDTTYTNKSGLFLNKLTDVLQGEGIKMTPQISTKAAAIADALHHQEKEWKSQGMLFPPGEALTKEGK